MTLYLFISDLDEHAELTEGFGRFTDIRPSRPSLAQRQIVLVSFTGDAVDAVGRMTRGAKAANYKWRVTLDELTRLDDPLSLDDLGEAASAMAAQALGKVRVAPGGQLPESTAERVLTALTDLRPELREPVAYLRRISARPRRLPLPRSGEPIAAFERDAVGLALELAGLGDERRAVLSAWDGTTDEPFLRGITEYAVLEDRAIEHDARVFGDWEMVRSGMAGIARFESRGRRVTIINVNRAGIETAVGVDLVYHTQEYDAYVLVQYKRRERGANGDRWTFRPNGQFDQQVERMRSLVQSKAEPRLPHEYRLDPQCCFLKICAPTMPDAYSPDLINGVYLPLAYWDCLSASGAVVGERGGRALSDRSVGRYLTNSLFVALVQASWVGSRQATSRQITEVIAAGLASNESLILAHVATDQQVPASTGQHPEDPPF